MTLSLNKATEQVVLNLNKRGITDIPKDVNVSLLLDYSYSMDSYYNNGAVERVLQRLLSIANTIDDDGQLELVLFENKAHHYGTVNVDQYDNVKGIIQDIKKKFNMGGTEFAPPVKKILEVLNKSLAKEKARGFFKNLFTKDTPQDLSQPLGKQLLVLISDGDNQDKGAFTTLVKQVEEMPNVYIQCIAIGYNSSYLQEIADRSCSVGYSSISDFSKTDDELINSVINKELLTKFSKV